MMTLEPVLTPHGLLTLRQTPQAPALEPDQGLRLEKAFLRGSGHGLLWLGADEVATVPRPEAAERPLFAPKAVVLGLIAGDARSDRCDAEGLVLLGRRFLDYIGSDVERDPMRETVPERDQVTLCLS